MDLGYRSNPNLHRAQKRPIQSADRSAAKVGDASQDFEPDLVRSDQLGSVTRNGKDVTAGSLETVRSMLPT
jgi:hypothetical protein